jgi:hypothetical protein
MGTPIYRRYGPATSAREWVRGRWSPANPARNIKPPRPPWLYSAVVMTSLRKALLYGFLVWLIPFVISVCLFGIRKANRPLFESIMEVVLALCAAMFLNLYFRKVERRFLAEGAILGVLWCAMSILFDLPLFSHGPMQMPLASYFSDIGVAYMMYPAIAIPVGWLLEARSVRHA